jgi:hypothetical protein
MPDRSPCIGDELVTPDQTSSGAFFTIVGIYGHRIRH